MNLFIYKPNDFFARCIPLCYVMGAIPKEATDPNLKARIGYRVYSVILLGSALFFNSATFYKLFEMIIRRDYVEKIITNYMLASLHLAGIIKSLMTKSKKGGWLLSRMIEFEKKVYKSNDKQILTLYRRNIQAFRSLSGWYFVGIVIVVACYASSSIFRPKEFMIHGNETIEVKQVPMMIISPFDQHDQHMAAFFWSTCTGGFLAIYFVTGDLMCFGFTIFAFCQIDILKYFIENFSKKSQEIQNYHRCEPGHAFRIVQRECIIMHQDIIRYVEELNASMKYLMLVDFLPGSIQIASLLYQLMNNLNAIQIVLLGIFIITLIIRLHIYCNNANKITLESEMIGDIWYQSDWTEMPLDVQRNMMICIARTQKPLTITVADFQNASLATFVAIMKATYTYMMFLTTF
ncbi:odorant receptor 67c-like [Rhynchophorus ferrugineus]|uniref:odorant receptor 67c-like n=1 Tax=Rhynchophorus ferrugineus TaxID=354439 RepID=UPI003FCE6E46